MKKSNAVILCLTTFVLGVLAGLFWAAYKGPPPGLQATAAPSAPGQQGQTAAEAPLDRDQVAAALQEFQKKIEAAPTNPAPCVEAGNFLFDHELFAQAIDYYRKAVDLGGGTADVLTDMGICYRKLGKPDQAVDYFRQAWKLDQRHENSALNLGIVLFHDLQDKKGALEAWRGYLALNPQGERAEMIRRVSAQIAAELGVVEK
ncbi:MAG: tetratricopeptide repeat protein [Pseudomonadota bacterium]